MLSRPNLTFKGSISFLQLWVAGTASEDDEQDHSLPSGSTAVLLGPRAPLVEFSDGTSHQQTQISPPLRLTVFISSSTDNNICSQMSRLP
jgi:hypothetical protein